MYQFHNLLDKNLEKPTDAEFAEMKREMDNLLTPYRGDAIGQMNYGELKFVIDELLPQGIYILSGSPKIGKSWLVLDMAFAVATGKPFWGRKTTQGEVLYYALEDTDRRMNLRFKKAFGEATEEANRLYISLESKGMTEDYALLYEMDNFMSQHPETKMIIIDTFECVRPKTGRSTNMYMQDYKDMNNLRQFASKHDIALVLVHHNRKMTDADPLNMISGSTAMSGGVDGAWVLTKADRTSTKGKLTISSRDIEGYCFDLDFDQETCRWQNLGHAVPEMFDITKDKTFKTAELINTFINFCEGDFEGSPKELCDVLNDTYPQLNLKPDTFSKDLRKAQTMLMKHYDIDISFSKTNNGRMVKITKHKSPLCEA